MPLSIESLTFRPTLMLLVAKKPASRKIGTMSKKVYHNKLYGTNGEFNVIIDGSFRFKSEFL